MEIKARSVLVTMMMAICAGMMVAGCIGGPGSDPGSDFDSDSDSDADTEELPSQIEDQVLGSGSSPPRNGITMSLQDGFKLSGGLNLGNGKQPAYGINLASGTITPLGALKTWLSGAPTQRLLKIEHLIECALPSTKTIKVTYGGKSYTYSGKYNLGPSIVSGLMTSQHQQQVSACLLALVNQAGAHDYIKMVASPNFSTKENLPTPSTGPTGSFGGVEASFGGNVFTYPPKAFMCLNGKFKNASQICNSRACSLACDNTPDQKNQGSCTVFNLSLDCSKVCSTNQSGTSQDFHHSCYDTGHNTTWPYMITTYVVQHGGGGSCAGDWDCTSGNCNEGNMTCL